MKNKFTFLFLFSFFSITNLFSQYDLTIHNPDIGWWGSFTHGTITEASFSIQPRGAYMEVGMFLTFSDNDLGFYPEDSLEVILNFDLPEGSFIVDSWLWMMDDTTIVRADILDYYTALNTYEDIVDRRQDPSFLYKLTNDKYQIRIYPLVSGETRKVKITYLVPTIWTEDKVMSWLPVDILNTSYVPLSHFQLITTEDQNWSNPRLEFHPDIIFQNGIHPNLGDVLIADIPESEWNKPFQFVVDAPYNNDGIFSQVVENGNEKFYQIAYLPPETPIDTSTIKKVVFLFDHHEDNSSIQKEDIYEFYKSVCREILNPNDQFNFIFSGNNNSGGIRLSEEWISADPNSMNQAFDQISNNLIDVGNISGILQNGIEFIIDHGEVGDIIVVSSSRTISTVLANSTEVTLLNLLDDYENITFNSIRYGNSNWGSVSSLIEAVVDESNGILIETENLWESTSGFMNTIYSEEPLLYDFHTSLVSGFTFDKYYQNFSSTHFTRRKPIIEIGKYIGSDPFEVNFSSFNNGNFISEDIMVNDMLQGDSLIRESWVGHYILDLELTATTDLERYNIVDISIDERVLSKFTAFLALDLEQGAEPCFDCWEDQVITVSAEELEKELGIGIKAFPNPFSEYIMIDLSIGEGIVLDELQLSLFDIYGKRILVQDLSSLIGTGNVQWTWNGQDTNGRTVSNGIYLLVIQTNKGTQTLKLNFQGK